MSSCLVLGAVKTEAICASIKRRHSVVQELKKLTVIFKLKESLSEKPLFQMNL